MNFNQHSTHLARCHLHSDWTVAHCGFECDCSIEMNLNLLTVIPGECCGCSKAFHRILLTFFSLSSTHLTEKKKAFNAWALSHHCKRWENNNNNKKQLTNVKWHHQRLSSIVWYYLWFLSYKPLISHIPRPLQPSEKKKGDPVNYHRSGNFCCKNIFVVCVNHENKKHEIHFTTGNHYSQHIFVHTVSQHR